MQTTTEDVVRLRRGLIAHGYRVVPCVGKRAQGLNWPNSRWSADQMEGLARHYSHATNTGILTGEVVAIDIDTPDEQVAGDISAMVAALPCGAAAPHRIGKAPKRCSVFRTGVPRSKVATGAYSINGAKCQVEVLGVGNQFVAYGIHPETGLGYEWQNGSPAETPLYDLPLIDVVDIDALLAKVESYLAERGTLIKKPSSARPSFTRVVDGDHPWSDVNRRALSNLSTWVPHLGLEGLRRYRDGYHSIASFRPTNSTTAKRRGRALNIQPQGICDYADSGRGYSPIDLVGVCLNLPPSEAVDWLETRVGKNQTRININFASIIATGARRAAQRNSF